jgi:heptosyltransferase-3
MTETWLSAYLPHPINWDQVNRVLIIKLRHHGDVLLTSPVFQILKNHHPHITIDALVYKETSPMLEAHPCINQIFQVDKQWKKEGRLTLIKHEWLLMKTLKQQGYDIIINLTESRRGAWVKWLTGARYGVAGNHKNRQDKLWKNAFPIRYPLPRFGNTRHTVEVHLDSLRRTGIVIKPDEKALVLNLTQTDHRQLGALLVDKISDGEDYIVIHPTSRWLFKNWRLDGYRQLIEKLLADGHKVVLSASPDPIEISLVNIILKNLEHPNLIRLDGLLSLRTLAALIQRAKLLIGVDSVPMHIAAAVDTACVCMFGPSGDIEWGPWNPKARIVTTQHTCRPCGYDGCGSGKVSECLAEISVQDIYQTVNKQLQQL